MTEPARMVSGGGEHLAWVRTRMNLDAELREWLRMGFSLIVAGFGSFAFLAGVVAALQGGEGGPDVTNPSKAFSLIATAIGVVLILLAVSHNRQMVAWVNADEFGNGPAPELPQERRLYYLAAAAVIIGVISFVALIFIV
jgi:uncharacterized membrane protein YidH (DUF202 family)